MDARHQDVSGVVLPAHDRPVVLVAVVGHRPVGLPPVGVDSRARLDRALDERDQAVLRDIIDALQSNAPETLGVLDLDRDRDDRLGSGLPAVDSGFDTADVRLVDLDQAGQSLAAGAHHRRAVAVQDRPRRLVRAQPERPLDAQR